MLRSAKTFASWFCPTFKRVKLPLDLSCASATVLRSSQSRVNQTAHLKSNYELSSLKIIIPLHAPLHPSTSAIDISDPFRDNSLVGLVLDLPRAHGTPCLDDNPRSEPKNRKIMPSTSGSVHKMYVGGGWPLIQRRRRLKKHWYWKHFKRDLAIYKKRKMRRKTAKEKAFREKLAAMISEAQNFDAKQYVEEFLTKIQWNETQPLPASSLLIDSKTNSPLSTGTEKTSPENPKPTKNYAHWTSMISVEQLYGLPASSKIDKKAGVADDEEWKAILEAREKYKERMQKRSGLPKTNDSKSSD